MLKGCYRCVFVSGSISNWFPGMLQGLSGFYLCLRLSSLRQKVCLQPQFPASLFSLLLALYRTTCQGCPLWQHFLAFSSVLTCFLLSWRAIEKVWRLWDACWAAGVCTVEARDGQHACCKGRWRWMVSQSLLLACCSYHLWKERDWSEASSSANSDFFQSFFQREYFSQAPKNFRFCLIQARIPVYQCC